MPWIPHRLLPIRSLLSRASRLLRKGNLSGAAQDVEAAMRRVARIAASGHGSVPADLARVWIIQSRVLDAVGDADGADQALIRAHSLGCLDNQELDMLVGRLSVRGSNLEASRPVLLDWVSRQKAPNFEAPSWRFLRRLSTPSLGDPCARAQATTWNRSLLAHHASIPWAHYHLGRIALADAAWEQARGALDLALILSPEDGDTTYLLAYACYRCGRLDEAETWLTRLMISDQTPRVHRLLAYVHRDARMPEQALEDIGRAASLGFALGGNEALIAFESLINTAQHEAAAKLGRGISDPSDPLRVFISAFSAELDGRGNDALAGYRQAMAAPVFENPAAIRILRLAAQQPGLPGALRAMNRVPGQLRAESYWRVCAEIALAAGNVREALCAWGKRGAVNDGLEHRIGWAAKHYLADHYNQQQFAEVLFAVTQEHILPSECLGEIAPVVAAALVGMLEKVEPDRRPQALMGLVQDLERQRPGLLCEPATMAILAVTRVLQGRDEEAHGLLARVCSARPCAPPIRALWAGLLLRAHRIEEARSALSGIAPADNPYLARLGMAAAAKAGDWGDAARWLPAAELGADERVLGIVVQAMVGALQTEVPDVDDSLSYYRALGLWKVGDRQRAQRALVGIADTAEIAVHRDCLLAWMRLQVALLSECDSDWSQLIPDLARWPQALQVLMDEGVLESALLAPLSDENREQAGRLLELAASGKEWGEPGICHLLAVFHLAEGWRHVGAEQPAPVLDHWERSLAYLAVALTNDDYLDRWIGKRLDTYEVAGHERLAAELSGALQQRWEGVFAQARDRWQELGRDEDAALLDDLTLSLRAELTGARQLRACGGFPSRSAAAAPITVGPTYLALHGLEAAFGAWLERHREEEQTRERERSWFERALAVMQRLDQEGNRDPTVRLTGLERAFSSMRIASLLAAEGHTHSALERLRANHPPCFPLARRHTCPRRMERACAQEDQAFASCNPAFAGPQGRAGHASAVREMEIDLLFDLGREAIAADEPDLGHWREALALARGRTVEARLRERIQETALGRVNALQGQGRLDLAIGILESIAAEAPDETVTTTLAGLYVENGIHAANRDQDWELATQRLRQAFALHPDSPRVRNNLALALHGNAHQCLSRGDPINAKALLEEAAGHSRHMLQQDPDNPNVQQLARSIRLELPRFGIGSGNLHESLFEGFLAHSEGGAVRLSTMHHNLGMEHAAAGHWDAAIAELEDAFVLEPDSEVTRHALAHALNARAVHLANAQRFDQAMKDVEYGLRLHPRFEPLRQSHESLEQHRQFTALLSRLGRMGQP